MTRPILIFALLGIMFAGFEGATDAAGLDFETSQDHGHEVHGSAHFDSHEHDGDSHHDDHFCHCSAHAAALLSTAFASATQERSVWPNRYDGRFSTLVTPPLLRPPNS
jgi:hypothetical protein